MNIARFQYILNHEDLDVLTKGLEEFTSISIAEHDCLGGFGYCGRSNSNNADSLLNPTLPSTVCGLLHTYLASSPQIEELFIVWTLVDRSSNNSLCGALNHCIAIILHCATSIPAVCDHIVNRIINEFWKNISAMLTSNNTDLTHSCLGLLISMCRTSRNNCSHIMQKMNFNDSIFGTMVQKGKIRSTQQNTADGLLIVVDSRALLIILIFTLLLDADDASITRILSSNSIVKKIMHGLTKDVAVNLELFLNCICFLIEHSAEIRSHIVDIVDIGTLEKLFNVYSEDDLVHRVVDDFQIQFTRLCCVLLSGDGKTSFGIRVCLSNVLKQLRPQKNANHRQLQVDILSQHTQFLMQCINVENVSWDCSAGFSVDSEQYAMITHLSMLLTEVPIDSRLKDSLKASFSRWERANKQEQTSLSVSITQIILSSMIPSNFSKIELIKYLNHSRPSAVLSSLNLLKAVLNRIQRILSECGITKGLFSRIISVHLFKWLPELQVVLDLSLKSIRIGSATEGNAEGNKHDNQPMEVSDDFEFNFLNGAQKKSSTSNVSTGTVEAALSYFEESLELLSQYVSLFSTSSSVISTNGDVLKLLHETIVWPSEVTQSEALKILSDVKVSNLISVLSVLRRASSAKNNLNWFGGKNDAIKQLMLVQQEKISFPNTSLSKLLMISSKQFQGGSELTSEASNLLKNILLSSGLFDGHGVFDFELYCESQCWLSLIQQVTSAQVPLLCSLLSTAYSFNADISCSVVQQIQSLEAPLSSVTLCLLRFLSGDLSFLQDGKQSTVTSEFVDSCKSLCFQLIETVVSKSLTCRSFLSHFEQVIASLLNNNNQSNFVEIKGELLNYLSMMSIINNDESTQINANILKQSSHSSHNSSLLASSATDFNGFVTNTSAVAKSVLSTQEKFWNLLVNLHTSCGCGSFNQVSLDWIEKQWKSESVLVQDSSYLSSVFVLHSLILGRSLLRSMEIKDVSSSSTLFTSPVSKKRKINSSVTDNVISIDGLRVKTLQLCDEILSQLKGLFESSSSSLASLLAPQIVSLFVSGLNSNGAFSDWCRRLLLSLSRKCEGMKSQTKNVASLWNLVSEGLVNLVKSSTVADDQVFIDLCVSVFIHSKSAELRSVIAKISPQSLICEEKSGRVSLYDLLNGNDTSNYSDVVNKTHELCQQKVNFIENDEEIVDIFTYDDLWFNPLCVLKSVDLIFEYFVKKGHTDVEATQLFMLSYYPGVMAKCRGTVSVGMVTSKLKTNYKLLLSAVALASYDFKNTDELEETMASFYSADVLTSFVSNVVLSCGVKGKLLVALTEVTQLLSSLNSSKSLVHFLAQYIQEYRHFGNRLVNDSFLSASLLKTVNYIDGDMLSTKWLVVYSSVIKYFLSVCSNYLIKNETIDRNNFNLQLTRLSKLFSVAFPSQCGSNLKNKEFASSISIQSELNKWLKCCLKFQLENALTAVSLLDFMKIWCSSGAAEKDDALRDVWNALAGNDMTDSRQPHQLFNMIVGHSKFLELFNGFNVDIKCHILRLLLSSLPKALHSRGTTDAVRASLQFVAQTLWPLYKGTLSTLDQLIIHFFYVLEHKKCFDHIHIQNMICGSKLSLLSDPSVSIAAVAANGSRVALTDTWLFDFVTPPMVYSTLSAYPLDRTLSAVSLSQEVCNNPNVFDLVYVLPAIFNTLRNFEVSIRRLTNCGALSLIMLGLSSSCTSLRSYSLSSLHLVYLLLHRQTPEVDSSFRERGQLMLAMSWLKNAFVPSKNNKTDDASIPSIAPMLSLFLSRAVLNIMQPNHELFSVINKYILAKPWCDLNDLPLFDFLVNQSDSQAQVSERLAVLRFLRDGLISANDHSLLCRKNGYNRLLLLFQIHSEDIRIDHAVLDIVEKGLAVKQSAKYLIERCELLSLVHQCTTVSSFSSTAASKFRLRALSILQSIIAYYSSIQHSEEGEDVVEQIIQVEKLLFCIAQHFAMAQSEICSVEMFKNLSACLWKVKQLLSQQPSYNTSCVDWKADWFLQLSGICKAKNFDVELQASFLLLCAFSKSLSSNTANIVSHQLISALNSSHGIKDKSVADINEVLLLSCACTIFVHADTISDEVLSWCLNAWYANNNDNDNNRSAVIQDPAVKIGFLSFLKISQNINTSQWLVTSQGIQIDSFNMIKSTLKYCLSVENSDSNSDSDLLAFALHVIQFSSYVLSFGVTLSTAKDENVMHWWNQIEEIAILIAKAQINSRTQTIHVSDLVLLNNDEVQSID